MGLGTKAVLIGACVLLAVLVTSLLLRRRVRGPGPALLAGALVLALGALNVYQLSAGVGMTPSQPAAADGGGGDLKARAERSEAARLAALPLPTTGAQAIVDRFAQMVYDGEGTWMDRTWLGVPCYQNPNDAWIHQELITQLKPDFIIEAGTAQGGSALLWAMILKEVNPSGKIITLDVADPSAAAVNHPLWTQYVEFTKGSSTDPATVSRIRERVAGKQVLVILDSDHSQQHVAAELKAYADVVPVGGYLIVQDTSVNGHPVAPDHGPGPMEAVDAFLASDDRFQADRTREAMLFTLHPKGYLKRVK